MPAGRSASSFDLLVKTLAFPIVLNCKQCQAEFCAAKDSPAARDQMCLTCTAITWYAGWEKNQKPSWRYVNWRWQTARMLATFSQFILVQRYLPYIPKQP